MARKKPAANIQKYSIRPKATWDISMLRVDLEEQADQSPPADKLLAFFARHIYPSLAVLLDPMPTLDDLYHYPPQALDALYLDVRRHVPAWFDDAELTEESLTFSDGKKITVQSKRPSVVMKLNCLEQTAQNDKPMDNIRREVFRSVYYPKLAGCSSGQVPTVEYARAEMSMEDLQLWYDAARRQNPDWFISLEELARQNQLNQQTAEKKSVTPA